MQYIHIYYVIYTSLGGSTLFTLGIAIKDNALSTNLYFILYTYIYISVYDMTGIFLLSQKWTIIICTVLYILLL